MGRNVMGEGYECNEWRCVSEGRGEELYVNEYVTQLVLRVVSVSSRRTLSSCATEGL